MQEITKFIEIDAGHRVTNHHSQCRNLHGHRYKVEMTVQGKPFKQGSQEGMVLDFGFMKDLLMEHVHQPCDHAVICWVEDAQLFDRLLSEFNHAFGGYIVNGEARIKIKDMVKIWGSYAEKDLPLGKAYFVPFVPTAENLAKHWFERLEPRVFIRSDKNAKLVRVRVWETPTSYVDYEPKTNFILS